MATWNHDKGNQIVSNLEKKNAEVPVQGLITFTLISFKLNHLMEDRSSGKV